MTLFEKAILLAHSRMEIMPARVARKYWPLKLVLSFKIKNHLNLVTNSTLKDFRYFIPTGL